MNTLTGLRPLDLPLAGQAAAWPIGQAPTPLDNGPRWLDGLAGSAPATLTADVPHDARGLGAAAHADRVLAALLAD